MNTNKRPTHSPWKLAIWLLLLLPFANSGFSQCTGTISTGQSDPCAGSTVTYTVNYQTGTSTYNWYLGVGATGTVISGQGSNTIQIQWDSFSGFASQMADINCDVYDGANCTFVQVQVNPFSQTIYPIYPTNPSTGPTNPTAGSTVTYTNTKPFGAAYAGYFTVSGGTLLSEVSDLGWPTETITATVLWPALGAGSVCWNAGYFNPYCGGTSCVSINILPNGGGPPIPSIAGNSSPCQGNSETYSVTAVPNATYSWTVTNGSIQSGAPTNQINVLWGNSGSGTVNVSVTNSSGSGSDQLAVQVSSQLTASAASSVLTVYPAYQPAACAVLSASATGGLGGYTYLWSTSAPTSSITVCPNVTTNYSVTVTDQNGCAGQATVQVNADNISCGNNKVLLCHNGNTRCLTLGRVARHLAHGDVLGSCSNFNKSILDASDLNPELRVTAFPNPFSESTRIQLTASQDEHLKVEIMNMKGQQLSIGFDDRVHAGDEISIPFSALSKGLYLCQVTGTKSGRRVIRLIAL